MIVREYAKNPAEKYALLGMGCMRLPTLEGTQEPDPVKSEEIIDYAYKHGVNYFDSAYVYMGGKSEVVMGQALRKYPRESYHVATKLPSWGLNSAEDVERIFNESLERLGLDYIDFYLCHNVSESSYDTFTNPELKVIPTLERLKAEGKIRHLGFSSHGKPETLRKFASLRDWDFAQIQMNYLDWEMSTTREEYEILAELGIPTVVMEPVRGGRLASLTEETDAMLKAVQPERSIASWAFRFLMDKPNLMVILSGMSNMEQVIDNVKTFTECSELSEAEKKTLDETVKIFRKSVTVPCTGCRYCCDDCPMQIDIPKVMEIYNAYSISKSPWSLNALKELSAGPKDCVGCGSCAQHCPQNIDIPAIMTELAEKMPG